MEGDRPSYVEAVAAGRITSAGRLAQAERRKGPATRMVDLAGKRFSRPAWFANRERRRLAGLQPERLV